MERLPVWKSADKIRIHWLSLLISIDVSYGLLNVFGRAESAAQQMLRVAIPVPMWGGVLIGCAVLIWYGYYIWGALGCSVAWGSVGLCSMITIGNQTALSWSAPVLFIGLMGFHLLISYEVKVGMDAEREQRHRGD